MIRRRAAVLTATLPTAALLAGSLALVLATGSVAAAAPGPAATAATAATSIRAVSAVSASTTGSAVSAAQSAARAPFPKLSASKIKGLAIGQFKKASSVHIAGTFVDKKEKYTLDLRIGKDAEGTMGSKSGSVRIRRVGNTLFLQSASADPAGAWLKLDRSNANYLVIARLTTLSFWSKQLTALPVSVRKPGKVFGGTPTIALYQPGKHGGTMWVATTGPAYLRYVKSTDGSIAMALDEWNAPLTVQVPGDTSLQPAAA
jgi:hypothetical protein